MTGVLYLSMNFTCDWHPCYSDWFGDKVFHTDAWLEEVTGPGRDTCLNVILLCDVYVSDYKKCLYYWML